MEEQQESQSQAGESGSTKAPDKKPYRPPQLTVFGSVQELTQIKNPGIADGINSPIP